MQVPVHHTEPIQPLRCRISTNPQGVVLILFVDLSGACQVLSRLEFSRYTAGKTYDSPNDDEAESRNIGVTVLGRLGQEQPCRMLERVCAFGVTAERASSALVLSRDPVV